MKKISLVKLLAIGSLIGVVSPVLADDAGKWFVGVEGGASKVFSGDELDGNSVDFGIKAGYYFAPNLRAYVAYNRNNDAKYDYDYRGYTIDGKANIDRFGIGYDVLLGSGSLKFLGGIQIGYAKVSLDESIDRLGISASASESGLSFEVRLGGVYDINANNEIEFGLKSGWDFINYVDQYGNEASIKHIGLYAGYSFKF